jgi:hypothetical protein
MVASLLKILTSGIQDERLYYEETLYPFYKEYRKAGRFTTQWNRIDFDNPPQFGQTAYFRITNRGHLCTRLFLVSTMPNIWTKQAEAIAAAGTAFVGPRFGWTNSLGHALVAQATLSIGGTKVETIDSRLLEVLDEYTVPLEKTTAVNRIIARKDNGFTETSFGNSPELERVAVPLPFWFSRGDPGCALPVDAIIADEIRVGITFRPVNELYYTESRSLATSMAPGAALWPMASSQFYASDPSGTIIPGISSTEPVSAIPGIHMPATFSLGETYILAEYIYLDQPEANRFRNADLQVPIVQHYAIEPFQTQGLPRVRIRTDIPNPTRDIYWMIQREEAPAYNAIFLATRDLAAPGAGPRAIWWPNATGLDATGPGLLRPGFAYSDSEPVGAMALMYEGSLVRMRTQAPVLYRSILPSLEQKKSPWVNRYYYNLPIGIQNVFAPPSRPVGEGNLDKIKNRELVLEFNPIRGSLNPNAVPRYVVYVWAETYNILRVYGGRAGLLFAY